MDSERLCDLCIISGIPGDSCETLLKLLFDGAWEEAKSVRSPDLRGAGSDGVLYVTIALPLDLSGTF